MTKLTLWLLSLTAAVSLTACGTGSSSDQPAGPAASAATNDVSFPGDAPVSTFIYIDRTALGGDTSLEQRYENLAMRVAEPTITRGGTVGVRAFGRVGAHALDLYTQQVPSLATYGPAARDDAGQRAAVRQILDIAVGLKQPPTPQVAQALAAVTNGSGTDLARAVGQSLADFSGDRAKYHSVLILTDGWDDQPDRTRLALTLARKGPAAGARELLGAIGSQSSGSRIDLLWMAGLGFTGARRDPDAATLGALTEAWQKACRQLPVAQCEVSPSL